ncbi:hypothetical protein R3P38DRAFT_3068947 [Favolaschia claudopus]|uniref:Uncharacterized protein n=1 Tax=Favolaschia claudopus TaxID=2862362 RepID=A0AAW0A0K3_9AGAR
MYIDQSLSPLRPAHPPRCIRPRLRCLPLALEAARPPSLPPPAPPLPLLLPPPHRTHVKDCFLRVQRRPSTSPSLHHPVPWFSPSQPPSPRSPPSSLQTPLSLHHCSPSFLPHFLSNPPSDPHTNANVYSESYVVLLIFSRCSFSPHVTRPRPPTPTPCLPSRPPTFTTPFTLSSLAPALPPRLPSSPPPSSSLPVTLFRCASTCPQCKRRSSRFVETDTSLHFIFIPLMCVLSTLCLYHK